tara:strand:+ start:1677 stop:2471 length:795 start_codon:yes stop_codon:yes gene_type:complete
MATTTGTNIIDRARVILQDGGAVRWPDSELLLWVNDAQREIAFLKPDASSVNDIAKLRANTTKQTMSGIEITSGGGTPNANRILRVVRNIHSVGGSSDFADNNSNGAGRAIRLVSREILDSQDPNWHDPSAATGSSTFVSTGGNIKHYVFDEIDPTTFYVYPGVASGQSVYVELIYSAVPAALSAKTDTINIPDTYANTMVDYVCYRALSKDAEFAANAQRSQAHLIAFNNTLGIKSSLDNRTSPNSTVVYTNSADQARIQAGQ